MAITVHNYDPMTGNCLDCGARREEIDDNLFPACEKIEGPHRLAIIAVRREATHQQWRVRHAWRNLRQAEAQAVACSQELRAAQDDERALLDSLHVLKRENGSLPDKTQQTLAEAINRKFDPHAGFVYQD